MLVSWNWLGEYVSLDGLSVEEVTHRLTMAGLNLEEFREADGDTVIDLEVTSNRPDCLGHIGVAREISVLFDRPLRIPEAEVQEIPERTESVTSVKVDCPDLCPQYLARVIRGIQVGESPQWMQDRLQTVGLRPVNNIVDITNYVLLECSQPLHAFDFDKLTENRIHVRQATVGEKFHAINHEEYSLDAGMCVIGDARHPVALGGVMGGAETEISHDTTSVLIETANFASLSIRNTARKLTLFSDSSYRFERGVDVARLDWASRRCCQLILELAGGELLSQPVLAGTLPEGDRKPVTLRYAQIKRILGIEIPVNECRRILAALGLKLVDSAEDRGEFVPPSWRNDLSREVDLIEEVARIHGYDHIPDNVPLPLVATSKSLQERVADRVRKALTAAGFYESITLSFTSESDAALFNPRGNGGLLQVAPAARENENRLRQSLVPSLLRVRRENERYGTFNAQLFEIARVFLKAAPNEPEQRTQPRMVGMVSGRNLREVRGVVDALATTINPQNVVSLRASEVPQFTPGGGAEVLLSGKPWGWLGELHPDVAQELSLRDPVTVAELDLSVLENSADLVPSMQELPQYPGVNRDLNFVLDDSIPWAKLEEVARSAAGPLLESISFGGLYRGKQIPTDKKSYVITLHYRSLERTLTNDEVEDAQQQVIKSVESQLQGQLR